MKSSVLFLSLVTLMLATLGCQTKATKTESLYTRIGGQPAINTAVDLFYVKVLADEKVSHFFEDINMNKQANKQKQFLGAVLGGPVPYEGRNMRSAHKSLELTEADFGAIAGHLQATLEELKLDPGLIGEVMTLVATTKDDVLNR
ncbi:MAG: hemoglobin [Rhodothermales bacterium]|jgi:hemoglobin